MQDLTFWFQSVAQPLVDAEQRRRIDELTEAIRDRLYTQRDDFQLAALLQEKLYWQEELSAAQDEVFRLALKRAWADRRVTPHELSSLGWVVEKIGLEPERARDLEFEFSRDVFAQTFFAALADGQIDAGEEAELQALAANVGLSLPDYVRRFFRLEGQRFVQCVFRGYAADGQLTPDEWTSFWRVVAALGVTPDEARAIIQPCAQELVAQTLAAAQADGILSAAEERTLNWLLDHLGLPADVRRAFRHEMERMQVQTGWE